MRSQFKKLFYVTVILFVPASETKFYIFATCHLSDLRTIIVTFEIPLTEYYYAQRIFQCAYSAQ